jgi:hypothetical protein
MERPACFEIDPTARAVRRRRLTHTGCRRLAICRSKSADVRPMQAHTWECEPPWLSPGRTRSDLLFTMSNNTRTPRREPERARISNILDERSRRRATWHGSQRSAEHVSDADQIRCRRGSGGARRDRTDDLLLAKQALSQLSYGPVRGLKSVISNQNVPISDY